MSDQPAPASAAEPVETVPPAARTQPWSTRGKCKFAFEAVAVSVGLFTLIFLWQQMKLQERQLQQQAIQSDTASGLIREQIDRQAEQAAIEAELIRDEIQQLADRSKQSAEQFEQQRRIDISNRRSQLLEIVYGRRDCGAEEISRCPFLATTRVRTEAALAFVEIERGRANRPDLTSANLISATLSNALLSDTILVDADLRGVDLRDADLKGADLSDANLTGADLSGADLSDANLSSAVLERAGLMGADLSGADLSNADLLGTDLSGANLFSADLWGANLWDADLWAANLLGAGLGDANLLGADLSDANFMDAIYNNQTWTGNFDPKNEGAHNWDEMSWDEKEEWGKQYVAEQ